MGVVYVVLVDLFSMPSGINQNCSQAVPPGGRVSGQNGANQPEERGAE